MSSVAEQQLLNPQHPIRPGQPAWDIALLFPPQGEWTEAEYLALNTNRLVELSDGCLEVLPMPSVVHQMIVKILFRLLDAFVMTRGLGEVFFAPLPIRLWPGKMREPDLLYLSKERLPPQGEPPNGADLAVEVVSEGQRNRERDLEIKRQEYARARITEYWIVDPEEKRITVLLLDGSEYRVHGEFTPGTQASSVVLSGLTVDVASILA